MTKIKQEIENKLYQKDGDTELYYANGAINVPAIGDWVSNLFRSWALEMVDEDEVITHAMIGDPLFWNGVNSEKRRIRKKIEAELEK